MSEEKIKELIERSINVKKYFHQTGGNGMPVVNVISGEEFQQWIADIRAVVGQFKSDSFTESIINQTNGFNGWTDERDFEKLVASLNSLYKNQDYYINNKTNVINSNKEKQNRQRISEWVLEMLPLVNDISAKEALEKIGSIFQNKFDVQWTKGRANTSVHLYEVNKKNIVYGHLKIENGSIKCVGANGLGGSNIIANKSVDELKQLGKIDNSNINDFVKILSEALTQTNVDKYNKNLYFENESSISQNKQSLVGYKNDFDFDSNDKLEIETDVIAFASLIAYKFVNPPLAIGLFGKWGSGKSFFLEKLQRRIESLSKIESQSVYCKNIVHVKFNAWHYSDTNLWANLITQIFDVLYKQVSKSSSPKKGTLERLYEQLESTKALLEEEKEKLQKLNNLKTYFSKEIDKSNKELDDKNNKINQLSNTDFLTIAFETKEVKQSIKEIEDLIGNEINIQDIYIMASQLKSATTRFIMAMTTLKKHTGKKFFASIFACILVPIIIYYLVKSLDLKPFVKNISTLLATIVSFLTPVLIYVKPMLNKLKAGRDRLINLQEQILKIRESKRQLVTEQVSLLQKEIHNIELAKTEINKELFELNQKINLIDKEIKDITSGKMLLKFLEEKNGDKSYKRHLGLLASIRKDFETLDEILRNQDSVSENGIRVDRIVLYIDDLDRCPKEKVVEVLEAIHLLLAFPLFAVVVGVDQRWISSSLEFTYKDLLCSSLETAVDLRQEDTKHHEISRERGATPYDYLEKIFQVSFALKPLNRESINNYIEMSCKDPIINDHLIIDVDKSNKAFGVQSVGNKHLYEEEENTGGTMYGDILTNINPEKLELTREEIEFMKKISLLIGDTPRTIKRFINTYHIVRCHGGLRLSENRMEDYKVVMTLLATLFKDSKLFQELLELLKNNPTRTFGALIEDLNLPIDIKNALVQLEDVKDVKAKTFERNVSLVARFSFRPIAV